MMRTRGSLALAAFLSLGASGCTLLFPVDEYGGGAYTAEVMADHPVVYLRLGETTGSVAHDAVGHHDGTYGPQAVLGGDGAIAGDPDTAVTFDGTAASR